MERGWRDYVHENGTPSGSLRDKNGHVHGVRQAELYFRWQLLEQIAKGEMPEGVSESDLRAMQLPLPGVPIFATAARVRLAGRGRGPNMVARRASTLVG